MVREVKEMAKAWLVCSKDESMPSDELWEPEIEKDCPGLCVEAVREEIDVQSSEQLNQILADMSSPAMFGGMRLTIMRIQPKNLQLITDNLESVAEGIDLAAEDSFLIIMTHGKDGNEKSLVPAAAKKTLLASGCRYVEATASLAKKDFAALVAAEAKAKGLVLTGRQMDEIASVMKGDSISVRQEIGKLRMAADETGKIDNNVFQRLLYSENVENMFATLDAFFEGRTAQFAANMLQLENETLLYGILPMLSRQCRMIRDVRKLIADGADEKEIFKRSDLKYSFQLDKIKRQSRTWSDRRLAELEERLAYCERKTKQGQIADRGVWLESMLFAMMECDKKK